MENTEGGQPTTEDQKETVAEDYRNTPAFKALTKQVTDLREALLKKEQAEEKERAEKERQQLEAKGQYEEIVKKLQAEVEQTKKRHQRDLIEAALKNELYKANVKNEVFVRGAIAGFTGTTEEIGEYISQLVSDETNATVFGGQPQTGLPPPKTKTPADKSGKTLEERAAAGDKDAMNELMSQMLGVEYKRG